LFEREHHRRVAAILESLDAGLLAANGCLFGGGTAMVLRFGEYREPAAVVFLVSSLDGYRQLRQLMMGKKGLDALARSGSKIDQAREVRADQYGVRTRLRILGAEIKFEIVFEARISLDAPGPKDRICGVAALAPVDMAATKLLANSDRGRDAAVHSRDVIDLAMMAPKPSLLDAALGKARGAYGKSIDRDLEAAVARFAAKPLLLDECMRALHMTDVQRAVLWSRMRALTARRRRAAPH
jgi:hypothetical protein